MKKVIRKNVFETNSSSTHSISIIRKKYNDNCDIPYNSLLKVNGYSRYNISTSEIEKLNCIVSMIIYIINECSEKGTYESVISDERLIWTKEIIKEVRDTEIVYEKSFDYYPYIGNRCDDYYNVSEILNCDIYDELSFKKCIKEIIFDKNIIIEETDEEL